MTFSDADHGWMQQALNLARTGLGEVWPNPTVGCVLVEGGAVVGVGRTAAGGRPHAEVVALQAAGAAARGATAYVTLEPCSHWGHTPPCTDALIDAGVRSIVVAVQDPDPRVNGRGLALLREAGIDVACGLLEKEAAAINAGFFHRISRGHPLMAVVRRTDDVRPFDGQLGSTAEATLPGVRAYFSVRVEAGTAPRAALGPALAALGEQGLTHLAVDADDPLVADLAAAGMLPGGGR